MTADLIVVGAGLFGLTIAERAANELGLRVLIIDRRSHIGGNAYSETEPETGIEVHRYGAHLFHTSNERVWEYVNRFTTFTPYVHRVYTKHQGVVFPMPINLGTINQFFQAAYSPDRGAGTHPRASRAAAGTEATNLEEHGVSLIGRPLYEAFIAGYTRSSGRPIRASCRRTSSAACPSGTATTTGTSTTPTRACRRTATPRG